MAGAGLLLIGGVLGFAVGQARTSHAEDEARNAGSAADLRIVTYGTGMTGVFDPETRKIYLYDSNLVNCVAIREIETPGEPMKRIKG
jgi:hypothetical protein